MSNIFAKLAPVAVAVGLLVGFAPAAAAGTVTLQSLLDGGSVQTGHLTFTNFGNYSMSTFGGSSLDPNQVFVNPVTNGSQAGLNFQTSGLNVGPSSSTKIHLEFDVVSAPGTSASGASLGYQSTVHSGGNTAISASLGGGNSGLSVSTANSTNKSRAAFTQPTTTVHVSLDITLTGGVHPSGSASIEQFTILFDNPEPGSLTLLSLGVVGLLGYRWRRSAREGQPQS